ncbi:YwqJ-related putative deaminase [Plantactinospora sp. KBS50]|uniref:YwqJ-related putative deaminase n=1 Tax=Plantactinospora sp. KBS50 TaxID=2024580 RepID=UPI0035148120
MVRRARTALRPPVRGGARRRRSAQPGPGQGGALGARLRLVRVREPGDPAHGTGQQPCRSCTALLDWFGVEVLP